MTSLDSSLHPRTLAARLRSLAWLLVPVVVIAVTLSTVFELERVISDHRALFSVAVHWLPFVVAGLALVVPLLCAPWAALSSGAERRATRWAALAIGLLGAGLVAGFGELEFTTSGFATCCDLAEGRPIGLVIGAWLGPVLLGQSHLVELYGRRRSARRARIRHASALLVAWLGAGALALLVSSWGLGRIAELDLVGSSVALRAALPLIVMAGVALGRGTIGRLAPRLRHRWRDRREQSRGLLAASDGAHHWPDPAALAQGHRLNGLTARLRLAAWISLPMLGGVLTLADPDVRHHTLLGLLTACAGAFVLLEARQARFRAAATPPPPVDLDTGAGTDAVAPELAMIVALSERACEQLETGSDGGFDATTIELAQRVEQLDARALERFEQRGVDPRRVVGQLLDTETLTGSIEPERRRALHHQLRKFGAQLRGQVDLDPYRAQLPGAISARGLGWLRGGRSPLDPDLSRTRRRLIIGLSSMVFAIFAIAQVLGAVTADLPLVICMPGVDPDCQLAFRNSNRVAVTGTLVALTPVWLWVGARLAQWAAQLSFSLSLPPAGEPTPSPATRRRLSWAAWSDRVELGAVERWLFMVLATAAVVALPLYGYAAHLDLDGRPSSDVVVGLVLAPLLGLGLLLLAPLRRLIAAIVEDLVDG